MTNRNPKRKAFVLVAAVMVVSALVVSVVVFSAKKQEVFSAKIQEKKQQHPKDWLSSIPPVRSKVKDLEIINARIVRAGSETPGVAFEILNKSNRAVMAVDITCGEAGMTKDGLGDDEHPVVIIPPYGTLTAEMNDELSPGLPIVLDGATYEDGTEEGSESSLKAIHRGREHEKARLKAKKAGRQ
jgi:hypothetical protein